MKIREIRDSLETCNEAGWFAFDFLPEKALTEEDIMKFRQFGGFLYLSSLQKPFFKAEGPYFHIKGIKGETRFRIAVHGEHKKLLESIREQLEKEK